MKKMTCAQLGGPGSCKEEFHAETFEGMAELSKKHGMEMCQKSDEEHMKVMQGMKQKMQDPEAVKEWMESKKKEFDALPEDN